MRSSCYFYLLYLNLNGSQSLNAPCNRTQNAKQIQHGLRRKFPLRFPLICSLLPSLCSRPSEPRLAALRWVKASHRLEWEDRGLGAERKSVQDGRENPPPNSDTCESEPEHNRLFERPREVLMHRAGETITDGRRR